MSFKDIVLPKTIIPQIYKDNLVEMPIPGPYNNVPVAESIAYASVNKINFLGKNLKNILVLVHYPDTVHLPDEQLDFLSKILLACKLDIGDVAILNTSRIPATDENINILHTKLLLIFGECVSSVLDKNMFEFFKPTNQGHFSVMTSPALEKLYLPTDESKQLKSKLWNSLKQFFKL